MSSTANRGYGWRHQQLRARWAREIAIAGGVPCARCGRQIVHGMLWDLGHHDSDRRFYTGPEHRYCNRAAGARKANRLRKERRVRRFSRRW